MLWALHSWFALFAEGEADWGEHLWNEKSAEIILHLHVCQCGSMIRFSNSVFTRIYQLMTVKSLTSRRVKTVSISSRWMRSMRLEYEWKLELRACESSLFNSAGVIDALRHNLLKAFKLDFGKCLSATYVTDTSRCKNHNYRARLCSTVFAVSCLRRRVEVSIGV